MDASVRCTAYGVIICVWEIYQWCSVEKTFWCKCFHVCHGYEVIRAKAWSSYGKLYPFTFGGKKNRCFSSVFLFFCDLVDSFGPRLLGPCSQCYRLYCALLDQRNPSGVLRDFVFIGLLCTTCIFLNLFFKSLAKMSFLYIVYIVSQCVMSKEHIQIWSLSCRTTLSWLVFPVIQYIYIFFF